MLGCCVKLVAWRDWLEAEVLYACWGTWWRNFKAIKENRGLRLQFKVSSISAVDALSNVCCEKFTCHLCMLFEVQIEIMDIPWMLSGQKTPEQTNCSWMNILPFKIALIRRMSYMMDCWNVLQVDSPMNLRNPHDLVILMRQETTVNYLKELEVKHDVKY